jgi:hypothetical protein
MWAKKQNKNMSPVFQEKKPKNLRFRVFLGTLVLRGTAGAPSTTRTAAIQC